ncbi:MAG: tetratricopeptide repeat protein [Planctomycetes bacterium]|nr:tetratricopeptide repeat protein [Planctomycetota bacterium]
MPRPALRRTAARARRYPARRPMLQRLLVLAAIALVACASDDLGVRRMAEPRKASPTLARAAGERGDWSASASVWYELGERGGEGAAAAYVECAMALCEAGSPANAQRLLERALETAPDQIELREGLAEVMLRSGFRRAAEPHLERVLELDPNRVATLLALARLRFELGLELGAAPLLERRIALGGGDAQTWVLLARARRDAGDCAGAVTAYEHALALGESDAARLLHAATMYFEFPAAERGALDAPLAERWIARALALDPTSVDGHFLLGLLHEGEQRLDEAGAEYRRALELDLNATKVLRRIAEFYRRRGDRELALAAGGRYVEVLRRSGDDVEAAERWLADLARE